MTNPIAVLNPGPVAADSKTITRDALKQLIDRKTDFTLIEVLDAKSFGEYHLPGAINIPLNDQFETAVTAAVTDKNRKVVVYCGGKECDASTKAAEQLTALGYTNVLTFVEGKKVWQDALVNAAAPVGRPSIAPTTAPTIPLVAAPVAAVPVGTRN